MLKRESATLDESDFATAYRELIASTNVDWIRSILGCALVAIGGGIATLGGVYESSRWVLLGAGILAAAVGGFIQYYPHWKRS